MSEILAVVALSIIGVCVCVAMLLFCILVSSSVSFLAVLAACSTAFFSDSEAVEASYETLRLLVMIRTSVSFLFKMS